MPISPTLRRQHTHRTRPVNVGDAVKTGGNVHVRPLYGIVEDTCPIYGLLVIDPDTRRGAWFRVDEVRHAD